jgi:hypothetical protein
VYMSLVAVEVEESVGVMTAQSAECCEVLGAPCLPEAVTWEEKGGTHAVECDEVAYGNARVLREALAGCCTLHPSPLDEGVPVGSWAHSDLAPGNVTKQSANARKSAHYVKSKPSQLNIHHNRNNFIV